MENVWYCLGCKEEKPGPRWHHNAQGVPILDVMSNKKVICPDCERRILMMGQGPNDEPIEEVSDAL